MSFFDQLNAHGEGVGVVVVAPPPGLKPEQLFLQLRVLEMLNVEDPAGSIQGLEGSYSIRLAFDGTGVTKLLYGEVDHFLLHPLLEHRIKEFAGARCFDPNCPWPPLLIQSLHGPEDLERFPLSSNGFDDGVSLMEAFTFYPNDKDCGVVALLHGVQA